MAKIAMGIFQDSQVSMWKRTEANGSKLKQTGEIGSKRKQTGENGSKRKQMEANDTVYWWTPTCLPTFTVTNLKN